MEDIENSFELVESRDAIDLIPSWEPQLWWFFALAGGLLLMAVAVYFLLRKKTIKFDSLAAKREAYQEAFQALDGLSAVSGKENAVCVSIVIRTYLAKILEEPALYETHEEFIGRHDALKLLPQELREATSSFFIELAAMKYGPAGENNTDFSSLKGQAGELLERIHKA